MLTLPKHIKSYSRMAWYSQVAFFCIGVVAETSVTDMSKPGLTFVCMIFTLLIKSNSELMLYTEENYIIYASYYIYYIYTQYSIASLYSSACPVQSFPKS